MRERGSPRLHEGSDRPLTWRELRPTGKRPYRLWPQPVPNWTSGRLPTFGGLIRLWKRVVQEHTGFGTRVGGHADIAETAIMMALHPNLVRDDLAEEGLLLDPETADFSAMIQEGFDTVTPNGILGDARGATSELGEALLTALADFVAESFEGSA